MSPFWTGIFENLRERGRNATVFLVSLPCLLVATFLAAQVSADVYRHYVFPGLLWLGLVILILGVRSILRKRRRRLKRMGGQQLSADELRKARMKLVNRPAPMAKNSMVPPV